MPILDNKELDIEKETNMSAIVLPCDWKKEGHALWEGDDDSEGPLLPSKTRMAVRMQVLGKSGKLSVTNLWICFGLWDDSQSVKIQSTDVNFINPTIEDYVFPRSFPYGNDIANLSELEQVERCITDHIHVPQYTIDVYDALHGLSF